MIKSLISLTHIYTAVIFLGTLHMDSIASLTCAEKKSQGLKLNTKRITEITELLRDKPGTFGASINQRGIWNQLANSAILKLSIQTAEELISKPIPSFTDIEYREIITSGSRERHYHFHDQRVKALAPMVLAECLENQGRFLPRIEELIVELCSEKTWVVALRKKESLDNLEGRRNTIDLDKAMRAWELALTDDLLQDQLQPETRRLIRENLERRIFTPFKSMISGKQKPDWWLKATNNWNPVCLAGVIGAALTILESKDDRATFIAVAEKYSQNYLRGFSKDGYCSEGIGYWNFGVSHYVALSEAIWQSTNRKNELIKINNFKTIASFGANIEISNHVFPAFADCRAYVPPRDVLVNFLSRKFQYGLEDWEMNKMETTVGRLYELVLFAFPNSAKEVPTAIEKTQELEPNTYFKNAGVIICRPKENGQLGLALKGGHNNEHHNHNDVGTYTIAMGSESPLMDVGSEVYTHRTFSKKRYESLLLNSYGHPVPIVAGKLQKTGPNAQAPILKAEFTEHTDTIVLDLSRAYDVPELKKLERTFIYSREKDESITIIDEVEFSNLQKFETALMTLGKVQTLSNSSFLIWDKTPKNTITVQISASDEITSKKEILPEQVLTGDTATRIGISFSQPIRHATITTQIFPKLNK